MGRTKKGKVLLQKPATRKKVTVASSTPKKKRGLVNTALRALGGVAGNYLAGPSGAALGMQAGDYVSKLTGFGGYKINSNTIAMGRSIPTFRQGGKGVEICHREFLTDVTGSVGFVNTTYAINPGLSTSFPWLASVMVNFEEYELLGLVYEYHPSSGSAISSTSSALGVVILATNYDVLDLPFQTKQSMESYEFSTSTVPFNGCLHPVECAPGRNVLNAQYVRSGALPAGADQRMYDRGLFQIATQGMQSAYVVGELWVTYHLRARYPRIAPLNALLNYVHFQENTAKSATAAAPFGGSGLQIRHQDTGMSSVLPSPTSTPWIAFTQPGTFLYFAIWSESVGTITADVGTTRGANLTVSSTGFKRGTVSYVNNFTAATAMISEVIVCNAAGSSSANWLSITGITGMTSAYCDVYVFPVSGTLTLAEMEARMRELQSRLDDFDRSDTSAPFSRFVSVPRPCCEHKESMPRCGV